MPISLSPFLMLLLLLDESQTMIELSRVERTKKKQQIVREERKKKCRSFFLMLSFRPPLSTHYFMPLHWDDMSRNVDSMVFFSAAGREEKNRQCERIPIWILCNFIDDFWFEEKWWNILQNWKSVDIHTACARKTGNKTLKNLW